MDELDFGQRVVSDVTTMIEILTGGYCLYRFTGPFLANRRRAPWIAASYIGVMIFLYKAPPLYLGYFTAYIWGVLSAFVVMCLADRRDYEQKIFISVTFFALRWLSLGMAEILYDNVYAYTEKILLPEYPNLWFVLFVIMCALYQLFEFVFLLLSICCILRACKNRQAQMSKRELIMLSTPSVTSLVGYKIMWYYRVFYIAKNGDNADKYDALTLLYYAVFIITIVVVIVLYQRIKIKQEEKMQNELLAAQVENMRLHIERVEGLYQNIRSMKHDMKNHMLTLERLYAGESTAHAEEAHAYSTSLKESISSAMTLSGEINTGNPVTDIIIQEMKNEAEKKNIRFHSEFFYPLDSDINAFDVSIILNNALQNAVENAGDKEAPYISVISYRQNNAYMIEVKNSFSGELQWDKDTGLPRTAKKGQITGYGVSDGTHGFGLSNIRRTARKYSGDIDIVQTEGEFCLHVLLMLERGTQY